MALSSLCEKLTAKVFFQDLRKFLFLDERVGESKRMFIVKVQSICRHVPSHE